MCAPHAIPDTAPERDADERPATAENKPATAANGGTRETEKLP